MDVKEYANYLLRGCLINKLNLTGEIPDVDNIEYRNRYSKLTSTDCEIFKEYFFSNCTIINPKLEYETYLNNFVSELKKNCASNNFEKMSDLNYISLASIIFSGVFFIGFLLKRFCHK